MCLCAILLLNVVRGIIRNYTRDEPITMKIFEIDLYLYESFTLNASVKEGWGNGPECLWVQEECFFAVAAHGLKFDH